MPEADIAVATVNSRLALFRRPALLQQLAIKVGFGLLPSKALGGHCQTNLSGPAKGTGLRRSGCKLTPFRESGSAVLFEDVAGVEMAVVVEVVVD